MRFMVVSDIHANFPALQSVFRDLKQNFGQVEYVLCAGDFVGIGPYPNEVCDIMRGIKSLVPVKGEFDQAVLDGDTGGMNDILAKTVGWTRKVMTEDNLDFLYDMDGYRTLKLGSFNVLLLHGSPDNYLNGEISKMVSLERLQKYFEESKADIIVCGQGHVPFVKEYNGKFVINAGSVGQPKDNFNKSSYVFVDTDNMEIKFRRVNYNVNVLLDKMKKENFPESLINNFYMI